jgi:hypothetical protein
MILQNQPLCGMLCISGCQIYGRKHTAVPMHGTATDGVRQGEHLPPLQVERKEPINPESPLYMEEMEYNRLIVHDWKIFL